jgi:hypothetical protein
MIFQVRCTDYLEFTKVSSFFQDATHIFSLSVILSLSLSLSHTHTHTHTHEEKRAHFLEATRPLESEGRALQGLKRPAWRQRREESTLPGSFCLRTWTS